MPSAGKCSGATVVGVPSSPRGLEAADAVDVGGVVERAAGGMAVVTGRCGHGADRQQADQQGKEKRSPFLRDGIPPLCDLCRKTSALG